MESLGYILILVFAIASFWAISRWWKGGILRKPLTFLSIISIVLLFLELALIIFFKLSFGYWIFQLQKNPNSKLFEKSPYYWVTTKKNVNVFNKGVRIEHNENGLRGRNYNEELQHNEVKIAAIGGSTTYGVGVNNYETWPHILDSITGKDTVVYNLGIPGHSTVENLITAALQLDEVNPDIILLHVGLNDLRVSNVNELKFDYSNFHAPHMIGNVGLCYMEPLPKVATLFYLVQLMQAIDWYPICEFHRAKVSGTGKDGIDLKALEYYEKHLDKLIYLCKFHTDNIVVIPQILTVESIQNNALQWWIPYIHESKLLEVLSAYNKVNLHLSEKNDCHFIDEVLSNSWTVDEFSDPSHLNSKGNLRLAKMIRSGIVNFQDTISP